jgi:hypothetical protein
MCLALLPISVFAQTSAALFMLGVQVAKTRRPPHTIESLDKLIDLCEAWNKPEKAKEWRAKLPQTGAVEE